MAIDREMVDYVARLARIDLTPAERETFTEQLGRILAAVEEINELDTAGVEPTLYPIPLENVCRPDEPRPSLAPGEALANAPERDDDFFRLPRVVGE